MRSSAPHRRALPARRLAAGWHALGVEQAGDGTDGQPRHGVLLEDQAYHRGLGGDDLEAGRRRVGLLDVAVAVRRGAQYGHLTGLGTVALAAAGAFEDLRPFVLGDHPLELHQELVLRCGRRRCLEEHGLHTMAGEFFSQQHLIGILAAQPVGRVDQHRLDVTLGREVADPFQARPHQAGAAVARILEDPVLRYREPMGGGELLQRRRLAGNRVVLPLLVRGHPGVDRGRLHRVPPPSPWVRRRWHGPARAPGSCKPAPACSQADDQRRIPAPRQGGCRRLYAPWPPGPER